MSGLLGSYVFAVALSPQYGADHTLFAANSAGGLFKSTNGGVSWIEPASLQSIPSVLAVSPQFGTDHTVFAGTASRGVFKSTDGGTSWGAAGQGLGNAPVTALALSPSYGSDHTLLAGTSSAGVFVSTNSGGTWVASNQGLLNTNVHALALSPNYATDRTVFAATKPGVVYESTNGALSWVKTAGISRMLSDQTALHDRSLAISPNFAADKTVFVAMFEGLWKSTNAGGSWQYMETLPPSLVRSLSVSPSYSTDHTVIASNYGGGMIRTADGGQTWQVQNTGLVNCYPDPTAISPTYADGGTVFAGTGIGPEKFVTPGYMWSLLPVLGVAVFVRSLTVSPNFGTDQTVYLGTDNLGTTNPTTATYQGRVVSTNGLFVSTNGGGSWAPTGLNGVAIHSIAISPNFAADSTMFAASLDQGLFKSVNRGATWTKVGGVLGICCVAHVVFSPNFASDRTVFAAVPTGTSGQAGLYRSTDGGTTWTIVPSSRSVTILDIAVSPSYATDHTVFVGTLEHGVLMSTNGGQSLLPTGLADAFITALGVSPTYGTDRTLYAADYQGILVSNDRAQTWRLLPKHVRYEEDRPSIIRTGRWATVAAPLASCGRVLGSSEASDTLQFTFKGSQIAWIGARARSYGIAQVYLDGVLQGTVDLYASTYRPQQIVYQSNVLPSAAHTLKIVVTGQHDPNATGALVTLDALSVSP